MKKKILALLLSTIMLLALTPQMAFAAETHAVAGGQTLDVSTGELTLTVDGTPVTTYSINDGDTISVAAGATATITGSKNVMIDCGAGVALTIEDVTSDVSATNDACALSFTGTGNTLALVGTSTLKSGHGEPGVRVEDTTALEISGSGTLAATGDIRGAGIGSGQLSDGGTINISGGTVTATGGEGAAGIGGGRSGGAGEITISGGTVTAYGHSDDKGGAGIGSGGAGSGGNITISGGIVTATAMSNIISSVGAGIGSGGYGGNIKVTISGSAQVTATSNGGSAGIGGGEFGNNCTVEISGNAQVTATGGDNGAGIGRGYGGSGGNITISGGTVIATGGKNGAGIGGGYGGSGDMIDISGGTVIATGGGDGAGIGGGNGGDGGTVTISDNADVVANGGSSAAGIGGGSGGSGENVTISGGTVTANGKDGSAGIGGGDGGDGGTIDINGGIVSADSDNAYDIGRGDGGSDGTIDISGDAAVLLGSNTISPSPTAPIHTHYEFTADANEVYGLAVPAEWTPMFGMYLRLYGLSYNINGTPSPTTDWALGVSVTVEDGRGFSSDGRGFKCWNTAADGTGTDYAPGDTLTIKEDTTLYAQWIPAVTIDTPNLLAGILGESYSCLLSVSGGEGSKAWYASGLPKGLGIDRDTGKISGKPSETGTFSATVTVYDSKGGKAEKTYSLTVSQPSATGKYSIAPDNDNAYTAGMVDGFTTLTIKSGVTGFRLINAAIKPVIVHEGTEFVVFTHTRNGAQIGYSFNKADFDITETAGAAFNVQPGDIIRVYIVDALSNSTGSNPILLQ